MWDAIKAIVSKNSISILVIGAIFTLLGSVTDITIGQITYKTPDSLGRITLISFGIILIVSGLFFTFFEYKIKKTVKTDEPSEESNNNVITYRSTIRLKHFLTNNSLHSHTINYSHPQSSEQQQITAYDKNNTDDFWIIKGEHGKNEYYKKGNSIKDGDIIRLEHLNTRKNLHSHRGIPSPVTHQQEVTGFGTDGIGNIEDNWRIDIENGGIWTEDKRIRLIHITSNCSLHSHYASSNYTSNQQEVTAYSGRDENDFWLAKIIAKSI